MTAKSTPLSAQTAKQQVLANRHAIVIGGSMAGMLTARVLADHFDYVTVLDRDTFPAEPDHRKGVPQSHHAHGLLARGQIIIEQLFPGIIHEMRMSGAWAEGELVLVSPAGKLPSLAANEGELEEGKKGGGGEGAYVSRFFLEWNVRRRLTMLENIEVRSSVEVIDLLATADNAQVTGVQLRPRGDDTVEGRMERLVGDLVVDASGRNSNVLDWLIALGYDTPAEETINSDIGYASRFYEKPEDFPADWGAIIINGRAPDNPRAGLILPIEHDKWHVTVGGMAGNYPPTDEAGFIQWARDLPDPSLYEAIRIAKPITPIRGYRTPTNRLRRFEEMDRWPRGFIVTGDAVCCFNPIYGQGMTTSALDALAIAKVLDERQNNPTIDFEHRVRDEIAKTVAAPWLIATGEDLRWQGVKLEGTRNRIGTKLTHRYMNLYLREATSDTLLAGLYFAVINMLAPPAAMMQPRVVAYVLWKALTSGRKPKTDSALTPQALAELRARPAAVQ